jgi:uncharacterized protein
VENFMNLYELSVPQLQKLLGQLDKWLEAGAAYAEQKGFDKAVLLTARLAPDQYPLLRQVQAACDNAKFIPARLVGKQPPSHPDTEQTYDEIRKRIRTVLDYLGSFKREEFDGADTRTIELPFLEGKLLSGLDYLVEMALPNFYFHLTTAYAILRHNGVDLGKRDFIGSLNVRDR